RIIDREREGHLASASARRQQEEREDDCQRSHGAAPSCAAAAPQEHVRLLPETWAPGTRCVPGAPEKIRRRPTLPHGDRAVPSALEGLTAVFGMGTGVSPPLSPPEGEQTF